MSQEKKFSQYLLIQNSVPFMKSYQTQLKLFLKLIANFMTIKELGICHEILY
jgi:hypothetical protein